MLSTGPGEMGSFYETVPFLKGPGELGDLEGRKAAGSIPRLLRRKSRSCSMSRDSYRRLLPAVVATNSPLSASP